MIRVDKREKRKYSFLAMMAVVAVCAGIMMYAFVDYQMKRMEQGVLDVCATQQDAYVQLVLDQINLKQNRNNEEIVVDILGTLDASTNKYWTFSCEEDMIFVKDVLETNKYKGFTTSTYYSSESASDFLKELYLNKVTHGDIEIQDKQYIASGVVFMYGGNEYRLCLLTNRSVLLDNNMFLGAKTGLMTLALSMILLMVLLALGWAYVKEQCSNNRKKAKETIAELNTRLTRMDEYVQGKVLRDMRNNVWAKEALPEFIKKIKERCMTPITFVYLYCADKQSYIQLIRECRYLAGKNVLRFQVEERGLLLLFVKEDKKEAKERIRSLLNNRVTLKRVFTITAQDKITMKDIRMLWKWEND